jgi:hypothetical protein
MSDLTALANGIPSGMSTSSPMKGKADTFHVLFHREDRTAFSQTWLA